MGDLSRTKDHPIPISETYTQTRFVQTQLPAFQLSRKLKYDANLLVLPVAMDESCDVEIESEASEWIENGLIGEGKNVQGNFQLSKGVGK